MKRLKLYTWFINTNLNVKISFQKVTVFVIGVLVFVTVHITLVFVFLKESMLKNCLNQFVSCVVFLSITAIQTKGHRWEWRVVIAVNFQFKQLEGRSPDIFQASSFQLLKLEIYCNNHSSLSSITAVQHAFHIYFIKGYVWRYCLFKSSVFLFKSNTFIRCIPLVSVLFDP